MKTTKDYQYTLYPLLIPFLNTFLYGSDVA